MAGPIASRLVSTINSRWWGEAGWWQSSCHSMSAKRSGSASYWLGEFSETILEVSWILANLVHEATGSAIWRLLTLFPIAYCRNRDAQELRENCLTCPE